MISQMVFSMLSMPPREASSSIGAKPVDDLYPPASASHTPLRSASQRGTPGASANAIRRSGATNTARTPPASAPMKIAVNGGNFSSASPTTMRRGRKRSGVMWTLRAIAAVFSLASKSPGLPRRKNTPMAMASASAEISARFPDVLVEVDAARAGSEIGGIRQRRGRVAEIGAGNHGRRSDRGIHLHVLGDAHQADADRAHRRPGAADAGRNDGADDGGGHIKIVRAENLQSVIDHRHQRAAYAPRCRSGRRRRAG